MTPPGRVVRGIAVHVQKAVQRARGRAASLTHNNGGLERIEAAHARMMLKTPLCPRRSAERRAGLYDGTNVRLRTPLEPNIFIVGSVRVA